MGMRAGLLLLLLLPSLYCPAQPTRERDDMTRFRRRVAGLAPVQRLEPTALYGRQLLNQSRLAEVRPLLQAALTIARRARLWPWAGRFYSLLGDMESIAGNNTVAVDYYLQALAVYRSIYAYDQQQKLCYIIGNEYRVLQNTDKSREYQQQAHQLEQAYTPPNAILYLFFEEETEKALQRGNQDSALLFRQKSLTMFRATRQWTNFYSFLDGYGVTLGQTGHYQEAEQIFRRCLAYGLRQGDHRRVIYEYMHLPEPLLHLGRLDEARRYATLALSQIDRDPERQDEHRKDVYKLLTQIAEARGQYRQALAYERLRNQYEDQIQNAEKSRQVAEVESRFQITQKQARIDRLDQDNRRQLEQISWQAGGLLALLALLALAGWQYRLIRRVNARLQTTNQTVSENNHQISEQAERLTVLMRELHHRVKNNLAIVSSLLRMQSKRLDDPRAVQAVQDGQRRVEAISLIHQQFYQTENLAEVSINPYVTELTEGLLVGYGFDPKTFDCRIEVADLQLDVEVAVPLGLILNEVLTNAFKYAYNDPATADPPFLGQASRGPARPRKGRPSLLVRLQAEPTGCLLLEVQDNGPGLPDQPAPGRRASFGRRLIGELTGQLNGQMSLTNRNGMYFRLWIPAQA